jgi:hypothetical protein
MRCGWLLRRPMPIHTPPSAPATATQPVRSSADGGQTRAWVGPRAAVAVVAAFALAIGAMAVAGGPDDAGKPTAAPFIDRIIMHGGTASWDMANPRALHVDLRGSDIDDKSIAILNDAKELYSLRITGDRITQKGLETLSCLRSLRTLDVYGLRLDRKFLTKVYGLEKLDVLQLYGAGIGDAELEGIRRLRGVMAASRCHGGFAVSSLVIGFRAASRWRCCHLVWATNKVRNQRAEGPSNGPAAG